MELLMKVIKELLVKLAIKILGDHTVYIGREASISGDIRINAGDMYLYGSLVFGDQWNLFEDKKPKDEQKVLYYFEPIGIVAGKFSAPNTFYSGRGFLTGDVTHWMPEPNKPNQLGGATYKGES